jgi:hypothetical protein
MPEHGAKVTLFLLGAAEKAGMKKLTGSLFAILSEKFQNFII